MTEAEKIAGELRPMATAPRDGRAVVLVYNDYSGVTVGRYGEYDSPNFKGRFSWFQLDRKDDNGPDKTFAGWLCAPSFPGWEP